MQRAIPANMISSLLPDEVFSAMQATADAVLQASNEKIDTLREAAHAGIHSAQAELDQLERTAVDTLEGFGFKTRRQEEDPLGPEAQPGLSDEQRRGLSEEWGSLSGLDIEDPMANLDAPKGWDGF